MVATAYRTRFFNHCWGVFEGGGVRGAALAGAFQAATESGVNFGRVAGTSAGSIIAALVAAKAQPEFISQKLHDKDFSDFLKPAQPKASIFDKSSYFLRSIRKISFGLPKKILDLIVDSGLYSSEGISEWLEEILKEILKSNHPEVLTRPVCFKDLPLPLHIVATDLTTCSAKIWSRETTPEDSVAYAVRCSCTIPFFFQPVRHGTSIYIDGGVLSNLPAFVFTATSQSLSRSLLSSVLCFRLFESPPADGLARVSDIVDFGALLSSTVVGGSTDLQLSILPDVYLVSIDTGNIKTTDFASVGKNEKDRLWKSGHDMTLDFIRNEKRHFHGNASERTYTGYDEKLLLLIQALAACRQSVWISCSETYWLYFTFPALAFAIRRKIAVYVIVKPPSNPHESHRQKMLQKLTAQVFNYDSPPFEGFLFDPELDSGLAIISSNRGKVGYDFDYTSEEVKFYSALNDSPVISSFNYLLQPWTSKAARSSPPEIPFLPCSDDELFAKLSTVAQYHRAKFSIDFVKVENQLLVLQDKVKEYKLIQIGELIEEFQIKDFELFKPLKIMFADGDGSIITPPVLERAGNDLVVIEGHTRLYYCLQNKIEKIQAIIVENVDFPLPGKPYLLKEISLAGTSIGQEQLTRNFKKEHLRKIEQQLHPIEP